MIKAYAATDIGQLRKINQDAVFASDKPIGKFPNLFIVADGMGGHKAGDFASRYAVDHIVERITKDKSDEPIAVIGRAIRDVNTDIYMLAVEEADYEGMGTTVVVSMISNDILYVANVGDSRLYVIGDDNKMQQITRDHSFVEELVEKGEISRDSDRYEKNKNIITRAVGAYDNLQVDFFEIPLNGISYVLMCSDGLNNMVSDTDLENCILGESDLADKVNTLINTANENGGRDNISAILIEINLSEV
jgi:Serine/threonine protein phosphatase